MGMNMSSALKYAHKYGWDKRNTTEVDNTSTHSHPNYKTCLAIWETHTCVVEQAVDTKWKA